MSDQSRRKFLRNGSIAMGSLALPGAASAATGEADPGPKLSLADRTVLASTDDTTVVAVSIAKNGRGQSVSPRDAAADNYVYDIDTETGSVSFAEVDGKKYEALTNGPSTMTVESAKDEVSTMGDTDIVQRSTTWGYYVGGCAAYSGHNHRFQAISAEFNQRVNDYSWTAIAGALTTLTSSALLTGGILLVGGIAAIVSDTDTITFGAEEYDVSQWGWNQTMYKASVAAGWERSRGALTTISSAPTHPTR
ncbi:hypothetical protein [Haloarchaeobius sp. HME9146]|uniref:hypothetical protein n=1 Tax=Haloarchaeobius sp. HME9146 TaxID=2978732 RepID=UPI0021C140F3|nr:hypothetical protein [Haloarchaeobius sp. HME9146]MCT9094695.1 hypothetical protein [Haloarchaeobius sp. HME9146]